MKLPGTRLPTGALALLPTVLLCACTGMYVGVQAPASQDGDEVVVEDLAARVDIYTINAHTLSEQLAKKMRVLHLHVRKRLMQCIKKRR